MKKGTKTGIFGIILTMLLLTQFSFGEDDQITFTIDPNNPIYVAKAPDSKYTRMKVTPVFTDDDLQKENKDDQLLYDWSISEGSIVILDPASSIAKLFVTNNTPIGDYSSTLNLEASSYLNTPSTIPEVVATGSVSVVFKVSLFEIESQAESNWVEDYARGKLGVAEKVRLWIKPEDTKGTWSLTGGGTLTKKDNNEYFTAPNSAATCVVTFTGINGTTKVSKTFTVVTPDGKYNVKILERISYPKGRIGAAAKVRVMVEPADVSFNKIFTKETSVDPIKNKGYFFTYEKPHPTRGWARLGTRKGFHNSYIDSFGSKVDGLSKPWEDGSFTWPIELLWKLPTTQSHLAFPSHQSFFITKDGTLTVTKFGYTAVRGTNEVITRVSED